MENKAPHFKHCTLSDNQVSNLWKHFIVNGYINEQTSEADFLYYFKGVGEPAIRKITWQASLTLLSIYIYEIHARSNRPEWSRCGNIFENVKGTQLCDIHCKPNSNDPTRSYESFFNQQKEVRAVIAGL